HAYEGVSVIAEPRAGGLELALHGASLEGALDWPVTPQAATPAQVRFDTLELPSFGAAVDLAPLIAALAPAAELDVGRLVQAERVLGRLHFRLETQGRDLTIEPLALQGAHDELRAALRCSSAAPCRLRFAWETRDSAATLADLGLRPGIRAAHGSVSGELDWPITAAQSAPRQWLAAVTGQLRLALSD